MVPESVVFSWTARSLLNFFTGGRREREELEGRTCFFFRIPFAGSDLNGTDGIVTAIFHSSTGSFHSPLSEFTLYFRNRFRIFKRK